MTPFKASRAVFIVPALLCASWLLAGCGGSSAPVIVTGPAYVLTDISNGRDVGAVAINNMGQVLVTTLGGEFFPPQLQDITTAAVSRTVHKAATPQDVSPTYAFLYSGGQFTQPGVRFPMGLNDTGLIVGDGGVGTVASFQSGVFNRIPAIGPASTALNSITFPRAVNNAGQVVGASPVPQDPNAPYTGDNSQTYHAFVYAGGQTTDLGTLSAPSAPAAPSGTPASPLYSSTAYAINNQGQIVGASGTAAPSDSSTIIEHAFLYSGGKMTDLGTLGGVGSVATGINNQGQIVGYAQLAGTSAIHAALWYNGQAQDLNPPGYTGFNSFALSINDAGQIVGVASLIPNGETSAMYAFVYRDGKMLDLNNQVTNIRDWKLLAARGINNQGQICGVGTYKGATRAFLLTPR